jgi:hypothetical protein
MQFKKLKPSLDSIYEQTTEQMRQNAINLFDVLMTIECSAPKIGIPGLDDILVEGVHQYMAYLMKTQGDKGGVLENITNTSKPWASYTQPMLQQVYKHILKKYVQANSTIDFDPRAAANLKLKDKVNLQQIMHPDEYDLITQSYSSTKKDREQRRNILKKIAEPIAHKIYA